MKLKAVWLPLLLFGYLFAADKAAIFCLLQRAEKNGPVLDTALQTLIKVLPPQTDLVYNQKPREGYNLSVVIVHDQAQLRGYCPEIINAGDEAFCIKTVQKKPLVLCLAGKTDRAILYAAHKLATLLETRQDLAQISVVQKPLLPHRIALVPASTQFGRFFRPGLFEESIAQLPALGANGVLIVPAKTHGTTAGLSSPPFRFQDGSVTFAESEVLEWQTAFDKIKAQGLDIFLLCPAWIPPGFRRQEVRDYYDGKTVLAGYESAAAAGMSLMLSTLFDHLPQIDGVVLHSLELPEMWESAVSIFPCEDRGIGESVLHGYLNAIAAACAAKRKIPCFWTHVSGVDGPMILQLKKITSAHPEIITIEDSYWPNAGWPFLPFMGYLPDSVRQNARSALFSTTTDGEYYGGAKLPITFADPFYKASREAVALKKEMVIVRLHEHDETVWGSLQSLSGVLVRAGLLPLWTPTPDLAEIWRDWIQSRFRSAAAEKIESALHLGDDILLHGLTPFGMYFMDHESIPSHLWAPGSPNFRLFSRPGTPLVGKTWDGIQAVGFILWQSKPVAISISQFRDSQAKARAAAERGSREIERLYPMLREKDYHYLRKCFDDALTVLAAIRLLGEAAWTANLVLDNYDQVPNPREQARTAISDLEHFASVLMAKDPDFFRTHEFIKTNGQGTTYIAPSLPLSLKAIAADYKKLISSE